MVVISLGILVTMCNAVYIVPARGDFSRQILAGGFELELSPALPLHP